jgi:hypothetical protein
MPASQRPILAKARRGSPARKRPLALRILERAPVQQSNPHVMIAEMQSSAAQYAALSRAAVTPTATGVARRQRSV